MVSLQKGHLFVSRLRLFWWKIYRVLILSLYLWKQSKIMITMQQYLLKCGPLILLVHGYSVLGNSFYHYFISLERDTSLFKHSVKSMQTCSSLFQHSFLQNKFLKNSLCKLQPMATEIIFQSWSLQSPYHFQKCPHSS